MSLHNFLSDTWGWLQVRCREDWGKMSYCLNKLTHHLCLGNHILKKLYQICWWTGSILLSICLRHTVKVSVDCTQTELVFFCLIFSWLWVTHLTLLPMGSRNMYGLMTNPDIWVLDITCYIRFLQQKKPSITHVCNLIGPGLSTRSPRVCYCIHT